MTGGIVSLGGGTDMPYCTPSKLINRHMACHFDKEPSLFAVAKLLESGLVNLGRVEVLWRPVTAHLLEALRVASSVYCQTTSRSVVVSPVQRGRCPELAAPIWFSVIVISYSYQIIFQRSENRAHADVMTNIWLRFMSSTGFPLRSFNKCFGLPTPYMVWIGEGLSVQKSCLDFTKQWGSYKIMAMKL
ncbi:hypothetical protein RRG08_012242 [Elysia crispata]|uniref:Uncharacterized protein n=1 Tax=Elysia crispata TaxID=231223 RepID=A0AAE0YPH2_9GAST|nr:hypothetical protein RRG08_012242 [Elysia crispata]